MLSAAQKIADVSTRRGAEASLERPSSPQTDTPALWSQWHITGLPWDVLSHIFSCLDCDDIVQVNDTCQVFRRVVQALHTEALFYGQCPELFRKRFPASRSWLKQMVKDGLHPFTTRVPARESELFNAEQQNAVLCFHTLGKMMFTSRYLTKEVFASAFAYNCVDVLYTPTSSNLLICLKQSARTFLLGQNDSGSWSNQKIQLWRLDHLPLSIGVSFSTNQRYFSIFGFGNQIQIYQRDSDTWQLVNQQRIKTANWFKVSPSGKYLVVSTKSDGIESIRHFDDQDLWNPMPLAKSVRINTRAKWAEWAEFSFSEQHLVIRYLRKLVILSLDTRGCWNLTWQTRRVVDAHVRFSPSEQHVAIRDKNKVVVLSLDSRGCWNLLWDTPSDREINSAEFCPSGSWLLIAYGEVKGYRCDGVAEMIKLNPTGKYRSQQITLPSNCRLNFSPDGKFLLTENWPEQYLLWGLLKSDQWGLCGDLTDPGTLRWPGLGQKKLELRTVVFSSCGNYLFTSTRDGAVKIWAQDEQGSWMVRGNEQCDSSVSIVRFSRSGVHALVVDRWSIRILGRDYDGFWSVKGNIPATDVQTANFHPTAEHLIVFWHLDEIRIWGIQRGAEPGGR